MRFRFKSRQLRALYLEEKCVRKWPQSVVDNFFEVMTMIRAAKDERDFYLSGLHFEKLSGKRAGQRSTRLTEQWRLIVTLCEDESGAYVRIDGIEDYH